MKLKHAEVKQTLEEGKKPLRRRREQKPPRARRETWCQRRCSSKDLHEGSWKVRISRKAVTENRGKRINGKKERTDFNGSDTKATGLENDADAAGGDAFAKATDDSPADENVFHLVLGEMREVRKPSVWVYTRAGRKVETVMEWNG